MRVVQFQRQRIDKQVVKGSGWNMFCVQSEMADCHGEEEMEHVGIGMAQKGMQKVKC